MCQYTYWYYSCGHDSFIDDETIEYCANRFLSGYSVDIYSIDMCRDKVVVCEGMADWVCVECSEDHWLEFELEE